MSDPDRTDPDAAWMELALEERLSNAVPPDGAERILAAARRSTTLEPRPLPRERSRHRAAAAAAAILLGTVVVIAVWSGTHRPATTGTSEGPALAPVRVLYVAGAPGWQYRDLTGTLLRDEGVSLQAWLANASPDFVQQHSKERAALAALPSSAAELDRYDVVLLGDVDPARLGGEPRGARWLAELVAFYGRGGGVGILCGDALPAALRGTALGEVVSSLVRMPPATRGDAEQRLQLTEAGVHHPVCRLLDDDAANAALWSALGPFHEPAPLGEVMSPATALVATPTAPALIVAQRSPTRLLLLAVDDLWRMRAPDPAHYDRFWHNVVEWLAGRTG